MTRKDSEKTVGLHTQLSRRGFLGLVAKATGLTAAAAVVVACSEEEQRYQEQREEAMKKDGKVFRDALSTPPPKAQSTFTATVPIPAPTPLQDNFFICFDGGSTLGTKGVVYDLRDRSQIEFINYGANGIHFRKGNSKFSSLELPQGMRHARNSKGHFIIPEKIECNEKIWSTTPPTK